MLKFLYDPLKSTEVTDDQGCSVQFLISFLGLLLGTYQYFIRFVRAPLSILDHFQGSSQHLVKPEQLW